MKQQFNILIVFLLPFCTLLAQEEFVADTITADTLQIGQGKSGYDDLNPSGGVSTVKADLVADDALKMQWINMDVSKKIFKPYYGFKRKLKDRYRVALGSDYMFLNQMSSFSFSEKTATSGIFRFYGTWDALVTENGFNGSFIVKIENRHKIGNSDLCRTGWRWLWATRLFSH